MFQLAFVRKPGPHRQRRQRARQQRLQIEALEDRTLLSFLPPVAYPTDSPYTVATGDFRGNGILDLAVVSLNRHTVSVFPGNGDGTFQSAVTYPIDTGTTTFVAVGDVNGDGHPDIVAVGSNVSVLLNNGDGTFQDAIITRLNSTLPGLSGIALGDVDGDGHLDIVTASEGIGVLRGNGDGTFRLPYFLTSGRDAPKGLVLADLRGTGILDLATVSFFTVCDPKGGECTDYGSVSVRFGTGDGFFTPSRAYDIGGAASTIAIGDFNGDGIPDLVTGNGFSSLRPSSMSVLLGNGDGTFQRPVYTSLPRPALSLVTADFNNDGFSDVAAAMAQSNTVIVFLSNGDGTFGNSISLATDRFPNSLIAVDFNGDNFPDLASANLGANTVSVFLNDTNWQAGPRHAQRSHKRSLGAANETRANGVMSLIAATDFRPVLPDQRATSVQPTELPLNRVIDRSLIAELDQMFALASEAEGRSGLLRSGDFGANERLQLASDWLANMEWT